MSTTQLVPTEDDLSRQWHNIAPHLPIPLSPQLDPGTVQDYESPADAMADLAEVKV